MRRDLVSPPQRWSGAALLLLAASGVVSCAEAPTNPLPPAEDTLPPGIAARVGSDRISAEFIARVAASERLPLPRAREITTRDALFANEARTRGLDQREEVALSIRAVLAHRLLRGVLADAQAAGPVTDQELRETTEKHWLDIDRPDGFRTVHAVVRLANRSDGAKRKAAMDVAAAMARAFEPFSATAAATDPPRAAGARAGEEPEDPLVAPLKLALLAVPHADFEVTVEALPPVAADARIVAEGGGSFDPDFSRAAARLARRGDVSPPVVSAFGVHVIMLLEKIPGHVVPAEERRALIRDEVMAARAGDAQRKLLAALRSAVAVDRSADALLAEVAVEP